MKTVYMCFSTDIIHSGHINIINRAAELGEVVAGVLCDEYASIYEKYPLIPQNERMNILKSIKGISRVVVQDDIYYDKVLKELRPDYVVHGDNWNKGYQKPVRERVIATLKEWGGELVEFSYTHDSTLSKIEKSLNDRVGMPETRRQRLQHGLRSGNVLRVLEAHDGLSALIAEKASYTVGDEIRRFDALWISSLCDSTAKGKPDIELVDLTTRLQTVSAVIDVTTKPIIFDADTGGLPEHFAYNVKTMERFGVSAVIIEDKKGLKRNSLFGTEVEQHQEDIEMFCEKIRVGKRSVSTSNFMIIARVESLILDMGMEDALKRAIAYTQAGADGIMIHSCKKTPDEIFEFCDRFRAQDRATPIITVPTTYHTVTEKELQDHGANVVIYANQPLRAAFPAMQKVAESILEHGRSLEADAFCTPIKEILTLI